MKQIIRFLFPGLSTHAKLRRVTLLSRETSSVYGETSRDNAWKYELLRGYGIAKTDEDCERILKKYRDKPITVVIDETRRQSRRRYSWWRRFWRRIKNRW